MAKRSWDSVEDLRPHLDPIVDELGRMPTGPELIAKGRWDLVNAISKFGGRYAVPRELGYPGTRRKSWKVVEDLRPHLDPIVAELGRMPNTPELLNRRRKDVVHAIMKFGGFAAVAQALGYAYLQRVS